MLYPLSYEGVPIQYKAPRTTVRHGTLEATSSHAYVPARALPARRPNPCSPSVFTTRRYSHPAAEPLLQCTNEHLH